MDINVKEEFTLDGKCIKQFLLDSFHKRDLKKAFSETDLKWLYEVSSNDNANLYNNIKLITEYVLSTFQAINFLYSNRNKSIADKNNHAKAIIIDNKENYLNTNAIHFIDISKYYNIKLNDSTKEYVNANRKKIVRKTGKWLVNGHTRKYKNGKVVFIPAHYKGPDRNSNIKIKTTFKVKNIDN